MKLGDRKVRLLKELEIDEISLVTSAANKKAKVMFWKSDIEKTQHSNLRVRLERELLEAIKLLAREKGITQLEASKQVLGSDTGQKILEILNTLKRKKGEHMYKSVGAIAEAMESGEIESQEDALKVFDEFVEGEVKKSDYSMDVSKARSMKMTGPGWDSYFNVFMNLPETSEAGIGIEKRQRASDNIVKVIEGLAAELIQKDGKLTKAKAIVKILDRNPAWKTAYEMVTYG